jgi:hypothetical protein
LSRPLVTAVELPTTQKWPYHDGSQVKASRFRSPRCCPPPGNGRSNQVKGPLDPIRTVASVSSCAAQRPASGRVSASVQNRRRHGWARICPLRRAVRPGPAKGWRPSRPRMPGPGGCRIPHPTSPLASVVKDAEPSSTPLTSAAGEKAFIMRFPPAELMGPLG